MIRRMSAFEIIMLVCFGAAWPFSIFKSIRSRSTQGKSLVFLLIVFVGYVSGIVHKLVFRPDGVIVFYCINCVLVAVDVLLFLRNSRIPKQNAC
jgi:hypothetical protein